MFLRPRVAFVIAAGLKLEWVYKNADCHLAAVARFLTRDSDQFAVRTVQGSHGRHQNSHPVLARDLGDGGRDLHLATMTYSRATRESETNA